MQVALDVIGAREQAQIRDAPKALRQCGHRGAERWRGNVVQHVVADDDVESLATGRRSQR